MPHSEEYYRTLWHHAVDSQLIVDGTGTIRNVNRRTEAKLGRWSEDLTGVRAADLFLPDDRERFQTLLREVLATGKELSANGLGVPTLSGHTLIMDVDMVLVLLTVFFFCIDLLYRDQKRALGTGQPGDSERPSGSRHAA